MADKQQMPAELTAEERKLIEYVRKVEYGEMLITIKNGIPCRIEEIHKSIPLK